ncbi:MAG: nucleoside monophosphate kinase [Verrucomicrobia bacterium]|nr:nucleoside monophosphate kinase [Verrucomicrobiota bacterium]MCH8512751.1 nucleoside monophosphate kinase [Kiritimatiellia bacterium]
MRHPEPHRTEPHRTEPHRRPADLEIKDAQIIFRGVWEGLLEEFGEQELRFPKELILLGGAPGAGKGTQTRFIMDLRGLTCEPIVVSSLLNTPQAEKIKAQGGMVGDREVIGIVFRELLSPEYRDGAILDGFPRTTVQVECLKLLINKMNELWRKHHETSLARQFRKPTIHVVILFVEEKVSIDRQLIRGREIEAYNREVEDTGIGEKKELRPTDLDVEAARRRYQVFKEQTWEALTSLKEHFFYHYINAQGPIREVEQNILREMQYQSSLELDPLTYDLLRHVPLSSEILVHARQELVHRLDGYAIDDPERFRSVLEFIQEKLMPIVKRHAITGLAMINTETHLLDDHEAVAMLIDIFSERGYHAAVDIHRIEVPETFDLQSGKIRCRVKKVYRIQIRFPGSEIRRG